jgi:hypothetical protein
MRTFDTLASAGLVIEEHSRHPQQGNACGSGCFCLEVKQEMEWRPLLSELFLKSSSALSAFLRLLVRLSSIELTLSLIVSQSSYSSTARAHKLNQRGSFLLQMKKIWFLFEESWLSQRLLLVVADELGICRRELWLGQILEVLMNAVSNPEDECFQAPSLNKGQVLAFGEK